MDTTPRNADHGHSANLTTPIAELEIVRVTRNVKTDGFSLTKNTRGTVVAVYDRGAAYGVEIADLPGGPEVVTLRADQIERTH
jgi:Domain of unknown function (DUF4926)